MISSEQEQERLVVAGPEQVEDGAKDELKEGPDVKRLRKLFNESS